MADYVNRIIVDTSSAVDNTEKLDRSLKSNKKNLDDVGSKASKTANDGMKNFSRGLIDATRAAQDFSAAGMLGISNNIIEVGARFGTFGVISGAVLTGVALNWKSFASAVESFTSRDAVGAALGPFKTLGSVITTAFKDGAYYADKFMDAILGENKEKPRSKLIEVETGVRQVELALKQNRDEQEKLTNAESLDAEQIKRLNVLRQEEVGLLEKKQNLMAIERVSLEAKGPSEGDKKRSGLFNAVFPEGSDVRKELIKTLTTVYGKDLGSLVFDNLSVPSVPNPELKVWGGAERMLKAAMTGGVGNRGMNVPVNTYIKDFFSRLDSDGQFSYKADRDFYSGFRHGERGYFTNQAERANAAGMGRTSDAELSGLSLGLALPAARAAANPFGPTSTNLGAREFAKDMRSWAPTLGPFGDFMAREATRAADPTKKAGELTSDISGLGNQVFGEQKPNENADKARRRKQLADILRAINDADPSIDPEDDKQIVELKNAVLKMIALSQSQRDREEAVIMIAHDLANSIRGGEMSDILLRTKIDGVRHLMRQRNPSLSPSY